MFMYLEQSIVNKNLLVGLATSTQLLTWSAPSGERAGGAIDRSFSPGRGRPRVRLEESSLNGLRSICSIPVVVNSKQTLPSFCDSVYLSKISILCNKIFIERRRLKYSYFLLTCQTKSVK